MELEEMKKIWDIQNNEALYAINESALRKSIHSKMKGASRISNINDIGLIGISIVTACVYAFINRPISLIDSITIGTLVLIAGYILVGRIQRKKREENFGQSMLDDLDHAIANVTYEVKRSRTMVWWFIVPLAIPILVNMVMVGAELWKWLFVLGSFALSYFAIRYDYRRCHIPKRERLEALRKNLMEEDAISI